MKPLKDLLTLLEGRKTYLIAAITAVLNLLVALNAISPEHLMQINMVLGSLGLAALRSGISKVE